MKIKNTEIKIMQADITAIKTDAIVNAANNKLLMGAGVAGAIKRKGGSIIEGEALKKGPIEIGSAISTSAGKLQVKYVIHAATMGMDFKTDEIKIRSSCASAFKEAEKLKISSIAFPALGCGVGGFPIVACAKIMAQEIFRHLRDSDSSLKEIIICLYDKEAYETFSKNALGYLGHIVNVLQWGPFVTVDIIIEMPDGIVLIERSNPPYGWAIPGGFLDYNESLEDCATREAKEETSLDIYDLSQFHTYSKPGRDPRFHTVTCVFTAKAKGVAKAASDAANLKVFQMGEALKLNLAFDHKQVLSDYFKQKM